MCSIYSNEYMKKFPSLNIFLEAFLDKMIESHTNENNNNQE